MGTRALNEMQYAATGAYPCSDQETHAAYHEMQFGGTLIPALFVCRKLARKLRNTI